MARISFLSGAASFRAATATDWSPAALNYPITIGDHVWTDRAGRVELQMGATSVDLDAMTATSVLNLDHHIVQLRLLQGSAIARVRELASDESLEIDTPNGAITLLRPGHWAWVEPWGWTWIDDAPWGFAPFHYGRWAYVGDGWV